MLCENEIFLRILYFFNITMNILRFVIPIILIVKMVLDIYHQILDVNDDSAKEKITKRIFASILIFLVPTIINVFLDFMETISGYTFNYSECNYNAHPEIINAIIQKREEEERLRNKFESDENKAKYQQNLNNLKMFISYKSSEINGGNFIGQKYQQLSDSQLKALCGVAKAEQGSIEGSKAEASLMANLYELLESDNKFYGKGLYNYVRNSGWFSDATKHMSEGCPSDYLAAVRDVLVNGNRTLPPYIDEHDCFDCGKSYCAGHKGDICYLSLNGQQIDSLDKIRTRSDSYYVKDKTQIHNVMGATYTFYRFIQEERNGQKINIGDPFGYKASSKAKFDSLNK